MKNLVTIGTVLCSCICVVNADISIEKQKHIVFEFCKVYDNAARCLSYAGANFRDSSFNEHTETTIAAYLRPSSEDEYDVSIVEQNIFQRDVTIWKIVFRYAVHDNPRYIATTTKGWFYTIKGFRENQLNILFSALNKGIDSNIQVDSLGRFLMMLEGINQSKLLKIIKKRSMFFSEYSFERNRYNYVTKTNEQQIHKLIVIINASNRQYTLKVLK